MNEKNTAAIKKPKALTVGSVMIDIITVVADNDIELMTMHNMTSSFLMLEQGRKIEAESISTYVGGGAANAAVSLSRLGLEAEVLALVGDDINAEKVMKCFNDEKVGSRYVKTSHKAGTGIAVNLSSHNRNAAIFTHRGANTHLTEEQVRSVDFSEYDMAYITSLSNESALSFPLIIKSASDAGCFVVSNPGIRQLTHKCDSFLASLKSIDLLGINTVECATLVPHLVSGNCHGLSLPDSAHSEILPPLLKNGFKIGGFSLGLVETMCSLSQLGPKYVVVTDGEYGAYLFHDNCLYFCPPQEAEMLGSAGAGDSFTSALAAAVCTGKDPATALFSAASNAASVISYVDTQTGLLTKAEMQDIIARTTIQNETKCWVLNTAEE